jgi:hypothetical protein
MLYDSNGQLLTSAAVSIDANSQTVFAVKAECRTGYFLSATAVDDLLVEARHPGDSDWIDIETAPLDLSAFDGNIEDFEIRFTAGNVSEISNRAFTLSVSAL